MIESETGSSVTSSRSPLDEWDQPPPSSPPVAPARILLVAPQPFFALRGTPLNVLQMVRALCGAGYDVHLATYGIGETVPVPGLTYHRASRIPGITSVPIGFSARKVAMDASLAMLVARLLITKRFDVVHAVEESIFFVLPLARLKGMPVIYDLDSLISDQLAYSGVVSNSAMLGTVRALERAALRRSSLAITVCAALSESVRVLDERVPIVQIEDTPLPEALRGPEPRTVASLRARWQLDGRRVALYTGNLEPYQGVELLLEAWTAVRARVPDARLLIVGGAGARLDRLRADHTDDTILFAGPLPMDAMPDVMALADVLVSPRRTGDNTPLKLYTYMYSGVPIVATNLRTHRQVLDDDTAVLCEPTAAALAGAIGSVLEDPAAFATLGARARARVIERHSSERFARKLLGAYEVVLAGRTRDEETP